MRSRSRTLTPALWRDCVGAGGAASSGLFRFRPTQPFLGEEGVKAVTAKTDILLTLYWPAYPTGSLAPWKGPTVASKDLENVKISSSDCFSRSMGRLKPWRMLYPVL